jgi:aspartate/methionine/tyrosine aminotransferase
MRYVRMPIEREAPEELGYGNIAFNLSESSIRDRPLSEFANGIGDLTLFYGSHRGDDRLRGLIAEASGAPLRPDDVLVTAGAAGALFIVATSLLGPSDHLVVVRPNYATNVETPRAIGCAISFVELSFAGRFRLDLGAVAAAIRPTTRLISVTCPHNPTGAMLSVAELAELVALAERTGCRLLVDETYRDMTYGVPLPVAAGLSRAAISVSSLSKSYGVPGIRIGWLITRDPSLYETLLAAKEQIGICGSVVDEAIATWVLEGRRVLMEEAMVTIRRHVAIMREWIAGEPLVDWVEPGGGAVCLPRLSGPATRDMTGFHRRLLAEHGTYVGPGHWFEMPGDFIRIGFGWPTETELRKGLAGISAALRTASTAKHSNAITPMGART